MARLGSYTVLYEYEEGQEDVHDISAIQICRQKVTPVSGARKTDTVSFTSKRL